MFKKGETTNTIQQARIRKTKMFFEDRNTFMTQLVKDIEAGIKQSLNMNLIPVFRLNGTSDLQWIKYPVTRFGIQFSNVFEAFPEVTFYDYTAVINKNNLNIPNYHLTFSSKESNTDDVNKAIELGMNVAVVFDKLPQTYLGREVFDGDSSDLRFIDPKNVIVGLKAKGRAKKDDTGFVKKMIPIVSV